MSRRRNDLYWVSLINGGRRTYPSEEIENSPWILIYRRDECVNREISASTEGDEVLCVLCRRSNRWTRDYLSSSTSVWRRTWQSSTLRPEHCASHITRSSNSLKIVYTSHVISCCPVPTSTSCQRTSRPSSTTYDVFCTTFLFLTLIIKSKIDLDSYSAPLRTASHVRWSSFN